MNRARRRVATACLALMLSACSASCGHPLDRSSLVVERYRGTVVGLLSFPAEARDSQLVMHWSARLTTLEFEPGSSSVGGRSIDLHGREAAFLRAPYRGTLTVGAVSGPAVTDVVVRLEDSGPVQGVSEGVLHQVRLGAAFSAQTLDVVPGAYDDTSTTVRWRSEIVPELDGYTVSSRQVTKLVAFDAASGQIEASFEGVLTVPSPANWVPIVSVVGALLVAAGLAMMLRRPRAADAAAR